MKNVFTFLALIGLLFSSCNSDDNNTDFVSECDLNSQIINQQGFDQIETTNYTISNVVLDQDCLEITFGASGCDGNSWQTNLYSSDSINFIFPPQRDVKLKLTNTELCQAVFQKTISFDLTPLRIEGQNEINLNIHGWEDTVTYTY